MYRKYRNVLITGLVSVLSLVLTGCRPEAEPELVADAGIMLVHNARIFTGDAGFTVIEKGAMAMSEDGEIIAIGDSDHIVRTFPEARRLDLDGKLVLPGLIDSHGHLAGLALSYTRANLTGTRSKAEVIVRLE